MMAELFCRRQRPGRSSRLSTCLPERRQLDAAQPRPEFVQQFRKEFEMKQRIFLSLLVSIALILALEGNTQTATSLWRQSGTFASPSQPEALQTGAMLTGTPLGNDFTYQGRLTDNDGTPVAGPCDFRFSLYASPGGEDLIGAIQTASNVALDEGYFTVTLDFGPATFTGESRYMKVEVKCGAGVYTPLSPRVRLTPTPYALHAVSTGSLQGYPVSDNLPFPNDVLTWNGNAWLPLPPENGATYDNVVVVAKDGGHYNTIQAALDSITDAADSNRYLVWVAPGRYYERVTMKPHVDIEGAGEWNTVITYPGNAMMQFAGTVIGANDAALRSLTVISTGGGNYAVAILNNAASPEIRHVTAYADRAYLKNVGVLNQNLARPVMTHVTATAAGMDNTENAGIENNHAFPTLIQVTASASGGYISSAVFNVAGAHTNLWGVTASASTAQLTFGVYNSDADAEIRDTTIAVALGVQQCGILNEWDGAGDVYVVTIENSQIQVADNTQPTIRSDDNFVVYVAGSRLHGGPVDTSPGGTVRCFACYNRQFENLGGIGACP